MNRLRVASKPWGSRRNRLYRVESKWFVKRSHFVVDETETEYIILMYSEDNEPDADTDYSVWLEDRTTQDFHELVSFTYDDNPAERNLLNGEFKG